MYGSLTLKPASQEGTPNQDLTFSLELAQPAPSGDKFEWYVDGVLKMSGSGLSFTVSFPNEGTYTVMAKEVDSAGKAVLQAQGTAVIKAEATNTAMPYVAISSNLNLGPVYENWLTSNKNYFHNWTSSEVPITWNGLNFSGKLEEEASMGSSGTILIEISGSLSTVPKPEEPFTLTLNYESSWDVTNVYFHDIGSVTYTISNIPMNVVAMTNQEGHWRLGILPPENKGTAVQKYLSNLVIKTDVRYIGDPKKREDYSSDQMWTYTDTTCANSSNFNENPTELFISIRSPFR
jgi:hypothetical protein